MNEQNPQPDPAKIPERPQLVGLGRARQLIAGAEHVTVPGAPGVALVSGMVAHANAIATISLAEATKLQALTAVWTASMRSDVARSLWTAAEWREIEIQIRLLTGFPIQPEEQDTAS